MNNQKDENMTTQLVKKEETTALAPAMDLNSWGEAPISMKDMVIPRILLMQGMSDLVTEGQAVFGEFRDSLTNKKLGDFKDAFKVIPICMKKMFIEYDVTNPKKKEFHQIVEITPENENLPYEDTAKNDEGKTIPISRDYTMNFYVLIPSEVARGGEIPYILSFRRTSLQAGKKLATQMYVTNRGGQLPPPGLVVEIGAKKEQNDSGTWATVDVRLNADNTRPATDRELNAALAWFKKINKGEAKVDTESFVKEENATKAQAAAIKGPAKF